MKKRKYASVVAGLSFATAFILFACSSDSPNDQGGNPNGNNTGSGDYCGGSNYDPGTHFCHFETIYQKCGGIGYDPAIQFCRAETIYSKCGDSEYDPSSHFCNGGTTYWRCGSMEYNPASQFCDDLTNNVVSKCSGEKFYPSTQFCYNSVVYSKCNGNEWNPATQICYSKGNGTVGIYKTVTIGTQIWMAENLSYYAAGSKCYDDNTVNCDKYGRLYNWAAAMNLASTCNSNTCTSQILAKHRGICPEGWHIPSDAEWTTLVNYVGSSTAGTRLKATNGWDNSYSGVPNGTDSYGFAALPGGHGDSDGSFINVGYYGYWWSATENNAYNAYYRFMGYNLENVGRDYDGKTNLQSVRCVKD